MKTLLGGGMSDLFEFFSKVIRSRNKYLFLRGSDRWRKAGPMVSGNDSFRLFSGIIRLKLDDFTEAVFPF